MSDSGEPIGPADSSSFISKIRARTPARVLSGKTGGSYLTGTQIELRAAHAAARDAVDTELDVPAAFGAAFVEHWNVLEVHTQAAFKKEYLLRPDLGRHFDKKSRIAIQAQCPRNSDIQIAVGDGLSVPAVAIQVPALLPLLYSGTQARGWKLGRILVVHHCRVGILNEIGELLSPCVAILLIGERPGLATTESLSAYMAYRPAMKHTDADRNLISNIHSRGISPGDASVRILNLVAKMMKTGASGYRVRESLSNSAGQTPATLADE